MVLGLAEIYLGGKVRIQLENVFLLFNIDSNADAEQIQIMKKILIEMKYELVSQILFRELMQRIQGVKMGTPDFRKQRKQMFSLVRKWFKNIHILGKTFHVRVEVATPSKEQSSSGPQLMHCVAFGFTMPHCVIQPSQNGGGTDLKGKISREDRSLGFILKSLQVYCDYDSESYCCNGLSHDQILKEFVRRYSTEKHTALLLPFELEIVLSADLRARTGIVTSRIGVNIPSLRIVADARQWEALNLILHTALLAHQRGLLLLRVPLLYSESRTPPFVFDVGGVHILPSLFIGGSKFPDEMKSLPRTNVSRVKAFLKSRSKLTWARELWHFAVKLIIEDLRLSRPYAKWTQLIKLPILRRKYAFYFSKLLKRSSDTGDYIYDVKRSTVDPSLLAHLFAIEMQLPLSTILLFRTFGVMVCVVKVALFS